MQKRLLTLIRTKQIYDAWLLLRGEFGSALQRYVQRRSRQDDVERICHDVWNDVYQSLPTYTGARTCSSWILELAQVRLVVGTPKRARSVARALLSMRASAGHPTNRRDLPALERVIATLPPSQRGLLELHYINELDAEAIGSFIGASTRRVARELGSIVGDLRWESLRSPPTRRRA